MAVRTNIPQPPDMQSIYDYKAWVRKEIALCRESGYLSREGLIRHLRGEAHQFRIPAGTAEVIISNLMNEKEVKQ